MGPFLRHSVYDLRWYSQRILRKTALTRGTPTRKRKSDSCNIAGISATQLRCCFYVVIDWLICDRLASVVSFITTLRYNWRRQMRETHVTTMRWCQTAAELSKRRRVAMQCCGCDIQPSVATPAPALAWCWRPYLTAHSGRFSIVRSPSCLPVTRSPAAAAASCGRHGGRSDRMSVVWPEKPVVADTLYLDTYDDAARNFTAYTMKTLFWEIMRDSSTLPTESHKSSNIPIILYSLFKHKHGLTEWVTTVNKIRLCTNT